MSYGIGIDLGGTKIVGVLTDEKGKILKSLREKTGDTGEGKRIISTIVSMIEKLGEGIDIPSVGVGCAGFVDHIKGIVHKSPNIEFLKEFPLKEAVEKRIKIPVFVDNDVKAGAVGEMTVGGGRGIKNFVFITLGTGIGGCIVVNGKILRGKDNMAGEIGHITIDEFGPICGCGKRGCLEALASGTFVKKYFIHGVKMGIKTGVLDEVKKLEVINAPLITKHAKMGDPLSLKVIRTSIKNISLALSILINTLNPEKIIIGGGLLNAIDPFFDELVENVRLNSLKIPFESTAIEKSKMAELGISVGASLMGILRSKEIIP